MTSCCPTLLIMLWFSLPLDRYDYCNQFVSHLSLHRPLPPLLSLLSWQGSKVVAEAIGRGGAKERRRVLKSMKGHALQLLTHRDAYLAIMRLVEVTDDTVALQKGLLAELCDETVQEKFAANPSLEDEKEEDDNEKGDEASAHSVPLAQVALHNNGSKLLLRLLAPANTKYVRRHVRR